jgi:hypothetical protein
VSGLLRFFHLVAILTCCARSLSLSTHHIARKPRKPCDCGGKDDEGNVVDHFTSRHRACLKGKNTFKKSIDRSNRVVKDAMDRFDWIVSEACREAEEQKGEKRCVALPPLSLSLDTSNSQEAQEAMRLWREGRQGECG